VCYGIGLMRPWGNSRLGSRVDHSRRPSSYTIALHILTVAASCATSLHAQDLPALTYSTEQGLTHDIVTRLVQDPRGFLWVGGTTDIARFDGEHFTTYGRAEGLDVGTAVNQLSFGPEGDLWIATNGAGVSRFNLMPRRSQAWRSTVDGSGWGQREECIAARWIGMGAKSSCREARDKSGSCAMANCGWNAGAESSCGTSMPRTALPAIRRCC
jgi:hypothetical protein